MESRISGLLGQLLGSPSAVLSAHARLKEKVLC